MPCKRFVTGWRGDRLLNTVAGMRSRTLHCGEQPSTPIRCDFSLLRICARKSQKSNGEPTHLIVKRLSRQAADGCMESSLRLALSNRHDLYLVVGITELE